MNIQAPTENHWSGYTTSQHKHLRSRNLSKTMVKTICQYDLIKENDKILVAISGGKDSYTLLELLYQAKQKAPFHFDLIAVHLNQMQPGYNNEKMLQWLKNSTIPFKIINADTFSIVKDKTKPGKAFCSLCSRLRRGILYKAAKDLGCNKIALGHHREDSIETLLLNLFYAGKIQAMPAKYLTNDGQFEVIRPLIFCQEQDIISHANRQNYPIIPCNLCGSQDGLKRKYIKNLIDQVEKINPNVRQIMLNALTNVQPTHLLDQSLAIKNS